MTIEIREFIIRAAAEARPAGPQRHVDTTSRAHAPEPARAEPQAALGADDREALVARCVREVLRELKRSQGR